MLRHHSGLYNFTDSTWMQDWRTEKRSKQEMVAHFREQPAAFSPGEKFQYSNTNYVLLGYIIEDLTAQPYGQVLQQRIAEPLGLTATYFPRSTLQEHEARSFQWEGEAWGAMEQTNYRLTHAAGALVSTPAELLQFMQALFHGSLVKDESLERMTKMESGFGLGLIRMPFKERTGYGHTGGVDGYQAQVGYFPEDSLGIALTSNALHYSLNSISIWVLQIVLDEDFQMPDFKERNIAPEPKYLKQFTGVYQSDALPLSITIRIEEGHLMGQATNQPAFPMEPVSDTAFKYEQAGVEMRFKRPDSGRYKAFYLHQMGQQFLFKRANP